MTERRSHDPSEGETELPTSELEAKIEELIDSYKDALKEAPEVSRVLLSSFLGPQRFSNGIDEEGLKEGNGLVFHRDNAAYAVSIVWGPSDVFHQRDTNSYLSIDRYPLKDGEPDPFANERLEMHVERDLFTVPAEYGSVRYQVGDITEAAISYRDYTKPWPQGQTYGAKALKGANKLLDNLRRGK